LEYRVDGKPVTFTATEIEGLEQIVSAGHKWLDGSNPAYPELILKVGRAFLEAQSGGDAQEMYLSETESWYLREIVPTNMRVRGESIGLNIKRKLYPLMLDFEAEKYSISAGIRYGSSSVDEPLTRQDAFAEEAETEGPEPASGGADGAGPVNIAGAPPAGEEDVSGLANVTETTPDDIGQGSPGEDEGVDSAEVNRDQPDG
jgi:hypothetical protein